MAKYNFFLTHSLEKVFPHTRPGCLPTNFCLSLLQGEIPAVQLVYYKEAEGKLVTRQPFAVTVDGGPVPARMRRVELLPSEYPCFEKTDDNYLTTAPGLFPDMLVPMADGKVEPLGNQYRALWIDFPGTENAAPGQYTIMVRAQAADTTRLPNGVDVHFAESPAWDFSFRLEVLPAKLPEQTILHTEWFHADCLADYYRLEVFSEAFWRVTERFIRMAADLTVNVMLTPVFTPALDTAVGTERATVQLVHIRREGREYRFGFENLRRWCRICRGCGITHIEVPHFFTQWGAKATPKIVADVDGMETRIFGWDVPAESVEYRSFLEAFIPALQEVLLSCGYDREHVIYHISDEPALEQLDSYRKARAQVEDLLERCTVIDAISDYDFYRAGIVRRPVPAIDHIQPFLDARVPGLWAYYCCAQCYHVSNRFYAMPSARNRIIGVLLYDNGLEGFLHWGFNFYSSQYSLQRPIDPYRNTHASYGFPSGDPYLVYPGKDGQPMSSIRAETVRQAFHDIRALNLLESLAGREFVRRLIRQGGDAELTFDSYPKSAEYLLDLRTKVNQEIAARL